MKVLPQLGEHPLTIVEGTKIVDAEIILLAINNNLGTTDV